MRDQILSRLEKTKGSGTRYRAKCPVRDHSSGDNTLSLLFNDDGRVLIHCHGGCEANEVLEAIGLSLSDLYPDGAIRDFMASAVARPKQKENTDHYKRLNKANFSNFEDERKSLKNGERFTDETLKRARELYRKANQ